MARPKFRLNLFDGFSLDMTADFTGLTSGEIGWLRRQQIVSPNKRGTAWMYSFGDLLVLRLVRLLRMNNVPVRNIKKAQKYLSGLDPSHRLTEVALYIGDSTGRIYYIGEKEQKDVLVEITQNGQLVSSDFVTALRVGKELERVRKEVLGLDKDLFERIAKPKLVPLERALKKYGLGG